MIHILMLNDDGASIKWKNNLKLMYSLQEVNLNIQEDLH